MPLGQHVVVVDGLEVDLAREQEAAIGEVRVALHRARHHQPYRVLDEAGMQVGLLDDEQLVGALEQLEHGRAHPVLGDLDQIAGVDLPAGADHQRRLRTLVVRRRRQQAEDLVHLAVVIARLGQPLGGPLADQALRAGARVEAAYLDSDHPPRAGAVDQRVADQVVDLLGRQARHRRHPGDRELGPDGHLRAQRLLALDHPGGDVLGQVLDVQRLADHHLVDGLGDGLGEAGHVHALLGGVEVDIAVDIGVVDELGPGVGDPDHLLDAGHTGSGQCQRHLGRRGLEIGCEAGRFRHAPKSRWTVASAICQAAHSRRSRERRRSASGLPPVWQVGQ